MISKLSFVIFVSFLFSGCFVGVPTVNGEGEPITLEQVRSTSVKISWLRQGDWTDEENYEILLESKEHIDVDCTETVICQTASCTFDSLNLAECLGFTACTSIDITVTGNNVSSLLTDVVLAPLPPKTVNLDALNEEVTCTWNLDDATDSYSCHDRTSIKIKTPIGEYIETLTDPSQSFVEQSLRTCETGEISCSVMFHGGTNGISTSEEKIADFLAEDAGTLISLSNVTSLPESLEVSWELKEECDRLTGYEINWTDEEMATGSFPEEASATQTTINGLVPCGRYNVQVQPLMENDTNLAEPISLNLNTSQEVPGAPKNLICEEPTTGYSFEITWKQPDNNRCIQSYYILFNGTVLWSNETNLLSVEEDNTETILKDLTPWTKYTVRVFGQMESGYKGDPSLCETTTQQEAPGPPASFQVLEYTHNSVTLTWDSPQTKNGIIDGYRIIWEDGEEVMDLVGQNSCVINNLLPKTNYNFSIKAKTESGKYGPGINAEVTTKTNITPIILGVVGGVLLAIIVVLAFVYRRRLSNIGLKMASARWRTSSGISDTSRRHGNSSNSPSYNHLSKYTSHAIKREDIRTYIGKLEFDSMKGLEEEFQSIKSMSPEHPAEASRDSKNRFKNRFTNILAYDHARVILPTKSDENSIPGDDYINASYIQNYQGEDTFIAAQGPKENTLEEFWNMIWTSKCDSIVMLTNLIERGREKCFKYWPDVDEKPCSTNTYTIHNFSEDKSTLHIIRKLEIEKQGEDERRNVKQYHFTAWPDFGAPQHEDQLLDFIKTIKSQSHWNGTPPMVVHCSAGVGRTGTFIGTWNLLDQINHEPATSKINIKGTVLAMRECRSLMVQAQDQYLYLCKCIAAYLEDSQRWNIRHSKDKNGAYDNLAFDD